MMLHLIFWEEFKMNNPTDNTQKKEEKKITEGRFHSEIEIASREVEIDFVLNGLPRGDIGTFYGNSGVGKSFYLINFLSSSENMLYSKKLKIAYLTFEDPVDVMAIRYKKQKMVQENPIHDFDVLDAIGLNLFEIGDNREKRLNKKLFKEIFEHKDYDLLILDTWAMASWQFEENSNSDLTQAMFLLKKVARHFRCSFLLVHHTNKSALSAENSTNEGALRGASSIIGNSRLVVSIGKTVVDSKENGKKVKAFSEDELIVKMEKVNFIKPEKQSMWRHDGGILKTFPKIDPQTEWD
jgi:RecA-family ATPase